MSDLLPLFANMPLDLEKSNNETFNRNPETVKTCLDLIKKPAGLLNKLLLLLIVKRLTQKLRHLSKSHKA